MFRFLGRFFKPAAAPPPKRGNLTYRELDQALQTTDPAGVLVSPRILRRVIRRHCDISGPGFNLPHLHSYVLPRADLLKLVEKAEIGKAPVDPIPDPVILLKQPDIEELEESPANLILGKYWRLLFHGAVHAVLEQKFSDNEVLEAELRGWIHQIGFTEFAEIRMVLEQENALLPPADDRTAFVEFAAIYLELRHFSPSFLERYFPGLTDLPKIDDLLSNIVNAKQLYRRTRPSNTPKPLDHPDNEQLEIQPSASEAQDRLPTLPPNESSESDYRRLTELAERAAAKGNQVRACIAWTHARRVAPPEARNRTRSAVSAMLDRFIKRLHQALNLKRADPLIWRGPLTELLSHAAAGTWNAETRLLYDLQKICVDSERNVFTVDPIGWILSRAQRPIKRPLPRQRDVLNCLHLHTAARRLTVVRLTNQHRHTLHDLLRGAADSAERTLRDRFRPLLRDTLSEVGLVPLNPPEQVAAEKLVEELLDRIIERGFLAIGDLRDALARSDLKLPDFSGVGDLLYGDPLLRADRRLAEVLPGVYRRGEFYLRWLQSLTSLAFGTSVGRWLTRYAAVPFGGAYMVVAFNNYLIHKVTHEPQDVNWITVMILGWFLLGILHVPHFRETCWEVLNKIYRGLRFLTMEFPRIMMDQPWFRRIVQSQWFRSTDRYLIRPAIITEVLCLLAPLLLSTWQNNFNVRILTFAAVNLLINSRLGRNLEEVIIEWLVQVWKRIGFYQIMRAFWSVMDFFSAAVEYAERVLYQMDEWLRFRSGEERITLVIKAILNPVWRVISYVARFCINLLIEPQINPIKHFPVVTVSHKLLLPTVPVVLVPVFTPVFGKETATAMAFAVATAIPGVFGFLVWELRENWRLYRANRPLRLTPTPIGRHGETMLQLLRPGFHSGTIPKRFAKLRKAERKGWAQGKWSGVRSHLHVLQEVETSLRHYMEREFLRLLNRTTPWANTPVQVRGIHLSANRVHIEMSSPQLSHRVCVLAFEFRAGRLLASISDQNWTSEMTDDQKRLFAAALTGVYKSAGVDLTRQEIESQLPATPMVYDLTKKELIVWPQGMFDTEARYVLKSDEQDKNPSEFADPRIVRGSPGPLPVIDRSRLFLKNFPVLWDNWVQVWRHAEDAEFARIESLTPVQVLPEKKVALVKASDWRVASLQNKR